MTKDAEFGLICGVFISAIGLDKFNANTFNEIEELLDLGDSEKGLTKALEFKKKYDVDDLKFASLVACIARHTIYKEVHKTASKLRERMGKEDLSEDDFSDEDIEEALKDTEIN